MKKELKEYNDSWDGMLPVNINKGASIPKLDLGSLYTEEDMFKVYDIRSPKSIEILGLIVQSTLKEYENIVAPFSALNQLRIAFNRKGYDIGLTQDRLAALREMTEGYVDFPITSGTSALYPYRVEPGIPGEVVKDDGIESKLGYSLSLRIHTRKSTIMHGSLLLDTSTIEGEIIPQDS